MTAVRAARASILLVLVALLSGCNLAGNGFQPGVAVVVDDQTITVDHIDQVTHAYCEGVAETLQKRDQKVSMRYLSSQVVLPQLTIKLLVEQLAEELGVEPTDQYRSELSDLRSRVTALDDESADAVVEVESARSYYIDVLTSIGDLEPAEDDAGGGDTTGDNTSGDTNPSLDRGSQVLSRWMASGEAGIGGDESDDSDGGDPPTLAINPRYGFRFAESEKEANEKGPLLPEGTEVSYAFSDTAKGALATDTAEDPDYLAGLPARMVCG
jgi:hypothetical protein